MSSGSSRSTKWKSEVGSVPLNSGISPWRMRCALLMMWLPADCRNTSVSHAHPASYRTSDGVRGHAIATEPDLYRDYARQEAAGTRGAEEGVTGSSQSGGWQVTDKRNEMDGTREVALVLDAQNEVEGFIGSNRSYLVIRAKDKPEVFIHVGSPFESIYGEFDATSVRLKFDDGTPIKQRWSESTNREAAFASSPVKLVQQLSASNKFLFEYTPFQKRATTVRFDLTGLSPKLEPLADVCGLNAPKAKSKGSHKPPKVGDVEVM